MWPVLKKFSSDSSSPNNPSVNYKLYCVNSVHTLWYGEDVSGSGGEGGGGTAHWFTELWSPLPDEPRNCLGWICCSLSKVPSQVSSARFHHSLCHKHINLLEKNKQEDNEKDGSHREHTSPRGFYILKFFASILFVKLICVTLLGSITS